MSASHELQYGYAQPDVWGFHRGVKKYFPKYFPATVTRIYTTMSCPRCCQVFFHAGKNLILACFMVDVLKQQLLELVGLLRGEFMYSETSDRVLSSYQFNLAMDVCCPSIRWVLLHAAKTNALSKVTHASIITVALRSTCNTKTSTTHLQWVRAMNYSMAMLNQTYGDFTEVSNTTFQNTCQLL